MMLYSTDTWDLVWALESASPASCKTPATSIDSIHPNNHPRRNKRFRKNTKLISYCLGLCTQNPGLREVDLEPSPKRGSDKINRLRPKRKKKQEISRIIQPGLTNENAALREVDFKPSAKRGTGRTKALLSLY